MSAPIDFVDEDAITVPGQRYALLSFVGPEAPQKSDKFAIKIRGVFGTIEDASRHAKKLIAADGAVHIYTVETGKWLLLPPPTEQIDNQEYAEEQLNTIMKTYYESREAAKIHHEQRKREIMKKGLDAVLTPEERLPPPSEAGPSESSEAGPSGLTDMFTKPDTHPIVAEVTE